MAEELKNMAAIALPLREMELQLELDTVRLRSRLDASRASTRSSVRSHIRDICVYLFVPALLKKLINSQMLHIRMLQEHDFNELSHEEYASHAHSLDTIVRQIRELVASTNEEKYSSSFQHHLETISGLTDHLDSFAESFHVAANSECVTALDAMLSDFAAEAVH